MCVCVYSFLFLCVCVCEWSCYSSGGEWQRTGVIGSSLSPQTGGTFHHRGISFQFSKPRHTSDAINKVFFFFPNTAKKNASQQLFNHPFDCFQEREQAPLCSQWGKKTRLEYARRRRQVQPSNATMTLCGSCNTGHRATEQNYQRTTE